MDGELVSKNQKKPLTNGFIPKLMGEMVTIRLTSGDQPIAGTLEGYSPYEILVQTVKGPILIFKHAIATGRVRELLKSDNNRHNERLPPK